MHNRRRTSGFVRHDFHIALAILLLTLAVGVPQALKHGLRGALTAVAGLVCGLAVLAGLLLGATWLLERGGARNGGPAAWLALGLRFLLFGLISALLGDALVLWHGLGPGGEDLATLGAGVLGGTCGCFLYQRLGPPRFWPAFGRFCLALLGSLAGGLLGILGPGNWGVDLGILVPLLIFAILAARGRIVPKAG